MKKTELITLKYILNSSCSYCGEKQVLASTQSYQHSSGNWNEYREWLCGLTLHSSPNNRNKIEEKSPCKKSEAEMKSKEKRKTSILDLEDYVKNLSVDEKFKEIILSRIRHLQSWDSS